MAGFVIALNDKNSLEECIKNGVYGTLFKEFDETKSIKWERSHLGTFTDYASMKSGDYIYFLCDRKIYGRGELVNIQKDCKYFNYPDAHKPRNFNYEDIKDEMLSPLSEQIRVVCFFKPSPFFFKEINSVDMDDVLNSNPNAFKMLRVFKGVSFIKIDDSEEQALFDILLRKNEENFNNKENIFNSNYKESHSFINKKLEQNIDNYVFNPSKIVSHNSWLEAGVELLLISQITSNNKNTIQILGNRKWDYISHQVTASPFKPIEYMDKMDIFGYSYINNEYLIRNKYLIVELKRDAASKKDINQLLKYVDFVNKEYAYGDYKMIEAYLIANKISKNVKEYRDEIAQRFYLAESRPAKNEIWSKLNLIQYEYNEETGEINLKEI